MKPLAIDLYCGLGGWAEGFLAEGYRVVGFDIERHDYGTGGYPGQLVLQDALTLHGRQFKDAAVIVASPPCQKYSYMAMPWSKAKALIKWYEESEERRKELTALFDACFRIQREASEAAGHYIPMVVENVRGAQRWVGRAKANYGSYYLWGDVGMVGRRVVAGTSLQYGAGVAPQSRILKAQPYQRRHGTGSWFAIDMASSRQGVTSPDEIAQKLPGRSLNAGAGKWRPANGLGFEESDAQKHNPDGTGHPSGSWFKISDSKNRGSKTPGRSLDRNAENKWGSHNMGTGAQIAEELELGHTRHLTNQAESDAVKGVGIGSISWHQGKENRSPNDPRNFYSKSPGRKAASAAIAKIPLPLARHIARSFSPVLHSTP